jgi:hypothetical protein
MLEYEHEAKWAVSREKLHQEWDLILSHQNSCLRLFGGLRVFAGERN